jgi:hypothetical protein
MTSRDKQHVQQPIITSISTIVCVTTGLPTYVPRGSARQPLDEGQPKDSLGGSSPRGDPLRGPPFNPHLGSFGWLTPYPRMFIPPSYQPPIV